MRAPGHGPGGGTRPAGFTLIELLVVVAIIAVLAAVLVSVVSGAMRSARKTGCKNNLRGLVLADLSHFRDHGELPPCSPAVPSSITVDRLTGIATYLNAEVPDAPALRWPKRARQPGWINCPFARTSGHAEGLTLGGGLYTGYIYVGGIENSPMVTSGMATLVNPGRLADAKMMQRGILWADILSEYRIADKRRYETFHVDIGKAYRDFRYYETEIDGLHRGWSDGAVEWVPVRNHTLSAEGGPALEIKHALGNFHL
jgi:prepilin-type N-terminal cleavage/methylation domain-containing protein